MSVVRKMPFIESFLGRLTADQLTSLLSTINSDTTPTRYSLVNSELFIPSDFSSDIIKPVTLELEKEKPAYNGFLIAVTDSESSPICLFIGYHRFQDLMLIELDPVHRTFSKINEYCDINELRRVLADKMDESGATTDLTPAKLEAVLRARTDAGIIVDRSEDDNHTEVALDQDVLDAITLKEITNATVSDGVITVPAGYVEEGKFYKFVLEIETSGTHTSASFDLCPYNESPSFALAYVNVGGDTSVEVHGAIQSDGTVTFQIIGTELASSDTILIHYLRYL